MAKAILRVGYSNYVVDLKDAVLVSEVLARAEIYESKYVKGANNTHHIYENESKELGTISLMADSFYQLAKLAGKPDKD